MALGDIDRHFAWHAWRLWHWTGSGGALGSPAVAVAVGVAGLALGDIDLHFAWQAWRLANRHFAWQAWRLATATFTLSFQNFPPKPYTQWYSAIRSLLFHRVLVTIASHFLNFPPQSPTCNGSSQLTTSSFIEFLSRFEITG